ncbi:uncharacterized protein [Diadema setosum]
MELRLFLLVALVCALAASLPATHVRERRTSNPVLRDKARDALLTKQFRIGSRYGRAWLPPAHDDKVFDVDNEDAFKYELRNLPLVQKIIDQLAQAEANDGF